MHTLGRDLEELMPFLEAVTTAARVAQDDAHVFHVLAHKFARSGTYAASVFLLTPDSSELVLAATSYPAFHLHRLERFLQVQNIRPQHFRFELVRSRTCQAVTKQGQTLRTRVPLVLDELFPSRSSSALTKDPRHRLDAVFTPLYRGGQIVGVLVMTALELPAHSIALAEVVGRCVSGALDVVDACSRQRYAEDALRRGEEAYRTLFERVPIGLYRSAPDGAIVNANPALVHMLGYNDKQSLLAVNMSDLVVNPHQYLFERSLVERDGMVRGYEMRLRCRDGSTIWVSNTLRAIRDAGGHVAWYQGSIENITARRESAERFRQMAEVIPVAFWMMSPDGKQLFYNSPATAGIYGRPCEDFRQRPMLWLEVVHPQDRSRVEAFWAEHAGQGVDLQYRIVRPDGQVRWVKVVSSSVRDPEDGTLLMLTGYVEDVTDRVQMHAALAASEQTLRVLLDAAFDSILMIDLQGAVLAANKAFALGLGTTVEALVGSDVRKLLPAQLVQERHAVVLEALRTGKPVRVEDEHDGRRWDWAACPVSDDRGNVSRLAIYARDVTEQRRVEAQLALSARLASLGTLAGGIAHELRNPLAVVSVAAQLLSEHLDDPGLCRQCVDMIRSATTRASDIIENVLALAGRLNETRTAVDVDVLILKASGLLHNRMAQQDVKLRLRRQPRLPKAYGNAHLMQIVFFNLISNACDAMPQGGTLTISTRSIQPGWITVRFRDTGSGIPPENLSRIFDPFFSTRPVGQGTGLGLPVSHRIIQEHGGSIEVRSQLGRGATFSVRLPVATADAASPQLTPGQATAARTPVEST